MSMQRKNVLVVGAGVIGLTSALVLAQKYGHACRVYVVSDLYSPNTTSDCAGAIYGPYLCEPEELVNEWGLASLPWFHELAKDSKVTGIHMKTGYMYFVDPLPESDNAAKTALEKCPSWLQKTPHLFNVQYMDRKKHPQLFSNPNFSYAVQYTVPMMDMRVFLPYLQHQCVLFGVQFLPSTKLASLQQANQVFSHILGKNFIFDAIINCTGLGSKELNQDDKVKPIRGQLIEVEWVDPTHEIPPFFIALPGKEGGTSSYLLPRTQNRIMLGGSFQIGNNDTSVDSKLKETIWQQCSLVVPHLQNKVKFIRDWVALRPYRESGVNMQVQSFDSTLIFHHYGHGACGVSIAYGSALFLIEQKIAPRLKLAPYAKM